MWQVICLCLPAVTLSERQRFFALFKDVLKSFGREPGEIDLSLFFLYGLSPEESLTVLDERRRLVERSQALLAQPGAPELPPDDMQLLMADHMRTLLDAEHEWLQRAIAQFHHQAALERAEHGAPADSRISST
jgi:hypothetical protein